MKAIANPWAYQPTDDWHPGLCIKYSNSIWLDSILKGNKSTVDYLGKERYCECFSIDFSKDDELEAISNWINDCSDGFLKKSYRDIGIEKDDLLSLINTILYKDAWKSEIAESKNSFNDEGNYDYLTTNTYYYYQDEKIVSTKINLTNGSLSLILPKENTPLTDAYNDIPAIQYNQTYNVNVSFPIFNIETDVSLNDYVEENLFSRSTSLNKLANIPVYLKRVQQSNRLNVTSEGICGGSITSFTGYGLPSNDGEKVDLLFDRPFVFVLSEKNDIPVFVGTICNL